MNDIKAMTCCDENGDYNTSEEYVNCTERLVKEAREKIWMLVLEYMMLTQYDFKLPSNSNLVINIIKDKAHETFTVSSGLYHLMTVDSKFIPELPVMINTSFVELMNTVYCQPEYQSDSAKFDICQEYLNYIDILFKNLPKVDLSDTRLCVRFETTKTEENIPQRSKGENMKENQMNEYCLEDNVTPECECENEYVPRSGFEPDKEVDKVESVEEKKLSNKTINMLYTIILRDYLSKNVNDSIAMNHGIDVQLRLSNFKLELFYRILYSDSGYKCGLIELDKIVEENTDFDISLTHRKVRLERAIIDLLSVEPLEKTVALKYLD